MDVSQVTVAVEPPSSKAAIYCLEAYVQELDERFAAGFDPALSISADAHELTPPAGILIVARLDGEPIGCGALKVKDDGVGEVKRMWVVQSARGLGVGKRILTELETHAEAFDLRVLRLETNRTLFEAQAMYRGSGYREVERFNDEPYAHHWFEKFIRGGAEQADGA